LREAGVPVDELSDAELAAEIDRVVYVGRPSKWGNPLRPANCYSFGRIIPLYRNWLNGEQCWIPGRCTDLSIGVSTEGIAKPPPTIGQILAELRGKHLACYCPLLDEDGNRYPCHADVLLKLANQEAAE